jgi:hypothetical protein
MLGKQGFLEVGRLCLAKAEYLKEKIKSLAGDWTRANGDGSVAATLRPASAAGSAGKSGSASAA